MKVIPAKTGPTSERPIFELNEIEEICLQELRAADLLPTKPEPIRIDRFIEKKFGISYEPADIDEGILGFTSFTSRGVQAVYVSRVLDEEGSTVASRRVRTTLAHEAGHGLLHAHLFAAGKAAEGLFEGETHTEPKILCRDVTGNTIEARPKYDGRWWEFQANRAMTELLLPRSLVCAALRPLSTFSGFLGQGQSLPVENRASAVGLISQVFDVNPIVADLRIKEIFG